MTKQFPVEEFGVTKDKARRMYEQHSNEYRTCLSCGQSFRAHDISTNDMYYLAIICEECHDAGVTKEAINEAALREWLKTYGPNRDNIDNPRQLSG